MAVTTKPTHAQITAVVAGVSTVENVGAGRVCRWELVGCVHV